MVKQRGLAMQFSKFTKVAVYFAGLVAASAMLPGEASAGLFDIFKARPAVNANSSGRQLIAFQTKAEPGTIIVSFADRKLYYVLTNNRAISYPIAGPKDGAEWAGEMTVTEKRVNPDWDPHGGHAACQPDASSLCAWRSSAEPARRARALSRLEHLPHPRHRRALTIGQNASSGCIRMFNNDVIDLYGRAKIGTRVVVTWQTYS